MARDYAHRSRSKKTSSSPRIPKIVLIVIVVLVALLVFGLAFIKHDFKMKNQILPTKGGAPVEQAKSVKETPIKTKITPKKTPVKFDFYNVLPKMKVSATIEAPVVSNSSQYVLQLASFNSEQPAKVFQEKVLKKGFRVFIFPAVRGDETWYRIQMGPYKNQDMAETARNKLEDAKLSSILVTV